MTHSFEDSTSRSRTLRVAGLLSMLGLVAGGMSACHDNAPSDEYKADGTIWLIDCNTNETENHQVVAVAGDTLLSLAREAGTELQQPIDMGAADVPTAIFAAALAKYAGIKDPDMIYAGQTYNLPATCEERPAR